MPEFTPEMAGRVAMVALFTEWRRIMAAGCACQGLLMDWRHRLAGGEFRDCPERTLMGLEVDERLAGLLGVDLADLPGDRWTAPDTIEGIELTGEA